MNAGGMGVSQAQFSKLGRKHFSFLLSHIAVSSPTAHVGNGIASEA